MELRLVRQLILVVDSSEFVVPVAQQRAPYKTYLIIQLLSLIQSGDIRLVQTYAMGLHDRLDPWSLDIVL